MIPQLHTHIFAIQQGSHVGKASLLPRIDHHKASNLLPLDGRGFHKAKRCDVQFRKQLLQPAFLGAGKKQHMRFVKEARCKHGGKSVKIRIGVAGDESGVGRRH